MSTPSPADDDKDRVSKYATPSRYKSLNSNEDDPMSTAPSESPRIVAEEVRPADVIRPVIVCVPSAKKLCAAVFELSATTNDEPSSVATRLRYTSESPLSIPFARYI